MKNKAKRMAVMWTAYVLIVLVLLSAGTASAQSKDICRRAATKCLVDAAIALILAGPHPAAIFAAGCLNGYLWCLKYYVDF